MDDRASTSNACQPYTPAGRWYYTKDQLKDTPSIKHGIPMAKEISYRQQAANFIQDMGQHLRVTQLCINTAIVYCQRFYMFHSFHRFHRNSIALAALFLAAKVEEQPRKLEHVIKMAHICLNGRDSQALDTKSEAYHEKAQELITNENIILQTLGFDVAIDHPHTHVVRCCQLVKASKELAQASYYLATNSLHLTTMCLRYSPTVVACFCIHLACKWSNYKIPLSAQSKEWFVYVDATATLEILEELTAEFLTIFEQCPSRLKNKIKASTQAAEESHKHPAGSQSATSHSNGPASSSSSTNKSESDHRRSSSNSIRPTTQQHPSMPPPNKQVSSNHHSQSNHADKSHSSSSHSNAVVAGSHIKHPHTDPNVKQPGVSSSKSLPSAHGHDPKAHHQHHGQQGHPRQHHSSSSSSSSTSSHSHSQQIPQPPHHAGNTSRGTIPHVQKVGGQQQQHQQVSGHHSRSHSSSKHPSSVLESVAKERSLPPKVVAPSSSLPNQRPRTPTSFLQAATTERSIFDIDSPVKPFTDPITKFDPDSSMLHQPTLPKANLPTAVLPPKVSKIPSLFSPPSDNEMGGDFNFDSLDSMFQLDQPIPKVESLERTKHLPPEVKPEPKFHMPDQFVQHQDNKQIYQPQIRVDSRHQPQIKSDPQQQFPIKADPQQQPFQIKAEPQQTKTKVEPQHYSQTKVETHKHPKIKVEPQHQPQTKVELPIQPKIKLELPCQTQTKAEPNSVQPLTDGHSGEERREKKHKEKKKKKNKDKDKEREEVHSESKKHKHKHKEKSKEKDRDRERSPAPGAIKLKITLPPVTPTQPPLAPLKISLSQVNGDSDSRKRSREDSGSNSGPASKMSRALGTSVEKETQFLHAVGGSSSGHSQHHLSKSVKKVSSR